MWIVIGLIIGMAIIALALRLRRKYVMGTLRFFGAYGAMSGICAYRKYGIWRLGTLKDREL